MIVTTQFVEKMFIIQTGTKYKQYMLTFHLIIFYWKLCSFLLLKSCEQQQSEAYYYDLCNT